MPCLCPALFLLLVAAPLVDAQVQPVYKGNRQLRIVWQPVENVQRYEVASNAFNQ